MQARRWTRTSDGGGYIYSFNGPHSLFADTIRSLRSLALAHRLGHALLEEGDRTVRCSSGSGCTRAATGRFASTRAAGATPRTSAAASRTRASSTSTTAATAAPATQQGYSPFTTWTRGLAWVMLGFAEQLEFLETLHGRRARAVRAAAPTLEADDARRGARASPRPLHRRDAAGRHPLLGHRRARPRAAARATATGRPIPFNDHEPVDCSAAAIAAQGLLRLGRSSSSAAADAGARSYFQAGLTIARTLLDDALSERRPRAPGPAAALRLPPPQRLGLRAPGAQDPLRRVQPVGRLPPARARALRAAARRRRPVLRLLTAPRAAHESASPSSRAARAASAWVRPRARGRGVRPRPLRPARGSAGRGSPRRAAREGRRGALLPGRHRLARRTRRASSRRCARRFGRLDALVNNAGVAPAVRADILEASEDSFDRADAHQPQGARTS